MKQPIRDAIMMIEASGGRMPINTAGNLAGADRNVVASELSERTDRAMTRTGTRIIMTELEFRRAAKGTRIHWTTLDRAHAVLVRGHSVAEVAVAAGVSRACVSATVRRIEKAFVLLHNGGDDSSCLTLVVPTNLRNTIKRQVKAMIDRYRRRPQ